MAGGAGARRGRPGRQGTGSRRLRCTRCRHRGRSTGPRRRRRCPWAARRSRTPGPWSGTCTSGSEAGAQRGSVLAANASVSHDVEGSAVAGTGARGLLQHGLEDHIGVRGRVLHREVEARALRGHGEGGGAERPGGRGLRPVGSHVHGLEEDDGALAQVTDVADGERRQDRGDTLRRQDCRKRRQSGAPQISGVGRGRGRQDQVDRGRRRRRAGPRWMVQRSRLPARTPAETSNAAAAAAPCRRVGWCLRPRYMTGSPLSAGAGPPRVRQRNWLCRQPRSAVHQPQRRGSEQPREDMLRFSTCHVK